MKTIMIQGTASNVGKSVLTAGFCRIFSDMGYKTAPFKAQNMALNSYITDDGKEIGRSTAFQAKAARTKAKVEMNPILLKPSSDLTSQIILMGKPLKNVSAKDYWGTYKKKMFPYIQDALRKLSKEYEILVIEGAGSPAEINLKENDIVNMAVAKELKAPVLLTGDIDRGGVIASLYGTIELLEDEERALVKGFLINKFRGDKTLFEPAIKFLKEKTNIDTLGVIPFLQNLIVEEEDTLRFSNRNGEKENALVKINILALPHISNFTDFDIFYTIPDISVKRVYRTDDLEDNCDIIIIPGTKSTLSDLNYLKKTGIFAKVKELNQKGTFVIGICGGYQMMGKSIFDPLGLEGDIKKAEGFSFINMHTEIKPEKLTRQVKATPYLNFYKDKVEGYEIHMGASKREDGNFAFKIENSATDDGIFSLEKNIFGTYIHGIFDNHNFTKAFLNTILENKKKHLISKVINYNALLENEIDRIAKNIKKNIDINMLKKIIGI